MKTKSNIFKRLTDNDIPYAICVANVRLRMTTDTQAYDYFIVAPNLYKPLLQAIGFKPEKKSEHKLTVQRALTKSEIDYFKDNPSMFVLAHTSADGKVYETKENSLKAHLGAKKAA